VKALVSELETALLRYQQRQDIPSVSFTAEPEIVTAADTVPRVFLRPVWAHGLTLLCMADVFRRSAAVEG
jgi:hypothetical protein